MTAPARPTALAAALIAAALLAGCGSGAPGPRPDAPSGPRLDGPGLLALADDRPATALPPATQTTAQAEAALAETLPAAAPVGGTSAARVKEALAFTARLVAATRADRQYLCGPASASPASALSAPALREILGRPGSNRETIELTIGSAGKTDDCGPLAWAGPGVVVGPQSWQARPAPGGGLEVAWAGRLGYALADGTGAAEPWWLEARATYGLQRTPAGWSLRSWRDARGLIGRGWHLDIPLPDGYLAAPPAAQGDPAALKAVHGSTRLFADAAAVTMTTVLTSALATLEGGERGAGRYEGTAVVAPARGDAAATGAVNDEKPSKAVFTDRGRTEHFQARPTAVLRDGRPLPKGRTWTREDDPAADVGGTSWDTDPFRLVALLGAATAAAPIPCPAGAGAGRCFVALVPALPDGPTGLSLVTAGARLSGDPAVALTVGLDEQGRPALVTAKQTARVFGGPYTDLDARTELTGYATAPPPPVVLPDPAAVIDDDELQH